MGEHTVAAEVVGHLQRLGIDTVFGIPGTHTRAARPGSWRNRNHRFQPGRIPDERSRDNAGPTLLQIMLDQFQAADSNATDPTIGVLRDCANM
jgi:hypothetical protein